MVRSFFGAALTWHSERKIELIDHKLDELTDCIKRLTSSYSHTSPPQYYSASAPPIDSPNVLLPKSSSLTPEAHDTGHYVPKIEFEGESSMSAHADYAARFL